MSVIAFEEWLHDHLQPESGVGWLREALHRMSGVAETYWLRLRTRRQLATLDEQMLRDIGISRIEMQLVSI